MTLRAVCFLVAIGIGRLVARRRNVLTLTAGAIGSSLVFYAGTNSVCRLMDPFYARSAAGWWQAMTVGHPEFSPTLWFFRNTLIGDFLFTTVFAVAFGFESEHERWVGERYSQRLAAEFRYARLSRWNVRNDC